MAPWGRARRSAGTRPGTRPGLGRRRALGANRLETLDSGRRRPSLVRGRRPARRRTVRVAPPPAAAIIHAPVAQLSKQRPGQSCCILAPPALQAACLRHVSAGRAGFGWRRSARRMHADQEWPSLEDLLQQVFDSLCCREASMQIDQRAEPVRPPRMSGKRKPGTAGCWLARAAGGAWSVAGAIACAHAGQLRAS